MKPDNWQVSLYCMKNPSWLKTTTLLQRWFIVTFCAFLKNKHWQHKALFKLILFLSKNVLCMYCIVVTNTFKLIQRNYLKSICYYYFKEKLKSICWRSSSILNVQYHIYNFKNPVRKRNTTNDFIRVQLFHQ